MTNGRLTGAGVQPGILSYTWGAPRWLVAGCEAPVTGEPCSWQPIPWCRDRHNSEAHSSIGAEAVRLASDETYLMKIYLVRHGQSQWQVDRDDDNWNSNLTGLGVQQADRLAAWMANGSRLDNGRQLNLAGLVASPLHRATQTARPIGEAIKVPVKTEERLREADFLVSDYLPSVDRPGQPYPPYQPAQPYADFRSQAMEALQHLVAYCEELGGPVMAVSHGGLISTLLRSVVGNDAVSFWIYNATIHLIEWRRGRWHMVFLNLWDHLTPDLRTY